MFNYYWNGKDILSKLNEILEKLLMRIVLIYLCFCCIPFITRAQVRDGWRSIYDKDGRLSRMNYYVSGTVIPDSNMFLQYYTENVPKVIVRGEIKPNIGCYNGSVSLFDQLGSLTSFSIKRGGETVFDTNCDYEGNCTSIWNESFDVNSGSWISDNCTVQNGEFILQNNESIEAAVFNPQVKIDLSSEFNCKLIVPKEGNTVSQGLAIGWKDENNFLLIELLFGKDYSIQKWVNGKKFDITNGRQPIEKKGFDNNIILISRQKNDLIVKINGSIQYVLSDLDLPGDKLALVTRSRGKARFSSFTVSHTLLEDDSFFDQNWVGKGTGFFISKTGKIMTAYENVLEAKRIRVQGKIDGKIYTVPAKIVRIEEKYNLAILQIDTSLVPFNVLPFGYYNHAPPSDSKVFCFGYPNAVSAIYMDPIVFEGKALSELASSLGFRTLELDFRNGMIGAPVFDWNFNFLGFVSYKGIELKYTEMIDFYNNSRLFKANFGLFESSKSSPNSEKTYDEKYKIGSQMVVIVETNMF